MKNLLVIVIGLISFSAFAQEQPKIKEEYKPFIQACAKDFSGNPEKMKECVVKKIKENALAKGAAAKPEAAAKK